MPDYGFNFRATSGFVVDGANETYSLGAVYPETRNGITFGWSTSMASGARDRVNTFDQRIAGNVQQDNSAGVQSTFQVDLPAPGDYLIRLALGDTSSQFFMCVEVRDGSTAYITLFGIVNGGSTWADTTGTLYSDANWPSLNAPTTITFVGTTLNLVLGSSSPQSNSSPIAHLFVSTTAEPAPIRSRKLSTQQRMVA